MRPLLRIAVLGLLATAIAGLPVNAPAQNTNKTASHKSTAATAPAKKAHPFHGKLAAVDKLAKTITVGKSVYQITSETKIKKDGKPATLSDGVVGEEVSGYVKPNDEGKLAATTLTFGKAETKGGEKKSGASEKTQKQ